MARKSKSSKAAAARNNVPGAALLESNTGRNTTTSRAHSDNLVFNDSHEAFSLTAQCTSITISPSDEIFPGGYPGANRGATFRSAKAVLAFLYACDQEYEDKAQAISTAGVNLPSVDKILTQMLTTALTEDEDHLDTESWTAFQTSNVKRVLHLKFRPRAGRELAKQLVATGDKILAYAVENRDLGIGYVDGSSGQFERIVHEKEKWGANRVGKVLMELREEFKKLGMADLCPPMEMW